MLLVPVVVYKVMKKVGKLTEARMVHPPEPKIYPMVSDRLFEAKVKRKKKLKEDGVPDPRDLASNREPQASLSNTNSPERATKASVQTGGPFDLTASQKGKRQDEDKDWIQSAEKDIKRRGTEGKCTPITKPGCTGKAKALAKTFKKMAKKRDAKIVTDKERKNEGRLHFWSPFQESTTPKPIRQARARAQAGKPIKKGTAKMVANDPKQDLDTAMKAGDKLS
jgi:hypothetical protein